MDVSAQIFVTRFLCRNRGWSQKNGVGCGARMLVTEREGRGEGGGGGGGGGE